LNNFTRKITMSLYGILPLAGGIAGAVATVTSYNKSSNRMIDNIIVPVGGFLAGAEVGQIAATLADNSPVGAKVAMASVSAVGLGAAGWTFFAWRDGKGHTDAGAVGMGILASIGATALLVLTDRATTKLLPVALTTD
jgi:hypothetical protein